MRKSLQREAILKAVKRSKSHPTADQIYEEVKKEIPGISLGTVYRNLRQLSEAGYITRLEVAGSPDRFDGTSDNHYHFRCEKCGRIFDIGETVDHSLEERIARKTGFEITGHYLEFTGICSACQKRG